MNEYYEQAIAKFNNITENKLGRYEKAICKDVKAVLSNFCRDNSEFAQAVAQSDKTFDLCLANCVKGCGSSISDLEVFSRAAAFWFEGAKVRFEMTLDLGDGGFSNDKKEVKLSLDSLFDF